MLKYPKLNRISFCTTCMNRLDHLKQTLPKNIEDNLSYPNLEFVIVNYSSTDAINEWIKPYLPRITYVEVLHKTHFNMSHAKNVSVRHATGDIVINVDADNFTGKGYAHYINNLFQSNMHIIAVGHDGSNVTGRLAVNREDFIELTGYDEHMQGWGFEDLDFMNRSIAYLKHPIIFVKRKEFLHTVAHDDNARNANYLNKNISETEASNRALSRINIETRNFRPNVIWGN